MARFLKQFFCPHSIAYELYKKIGEEKIVKELAGKPAKFIKEKYVCINCDHIAYREDFIGMGKWNDQ